MACDNSMIQLMHKVLDEEASEEETASLYTHMEMCSDCHIHFQELKDVEIYLHELENEEVPGGFRDAVMNRLPEREKSGALKWLQRHPVLTAAACFIILMSGYVFSLWQDTPFEAHVNGTGNLAYAGPNTVVVPKGEVVKGDVVVKNGKVKIEGKVDGNVVLINSQTLAASAGHVTGQIEEVNHILQWIWYHIKSVLNDLFIIHMTIFNDGLL